MPGQTQIEDRILDYDQIAEEVKERGFSICPNIYSDSECLDFVDRIEKIYDKRLRKGLYMGNAEGCSMHMYFRDDLDLIRLIDNEFTDQMMKRLIDENYVLGNVVAKNRRIDPKLSSSDKNIGATWHADTQYLRGQKITPNFGYFTVTCLEDFTKQNGATKVIEKSHLLNEPCERYKDYAHSVLEAKRGSVIVMASALWHKGGDPSETSRWSAFTYFTPWYFKPYYRFYDQLTDEQKSKLTPKQRKLLHCNSSPPLNEQEQLNTLIPFTE